MISPHCSLNRTTSSSTSSSAAANKKLLARAVHQATASTSSTRPQPTLSQAPSHQVAKPTRGVTVYRKEMAPLPAVGLVSRSRLREVAERDYDTQEFMTVETGQGGNTTARVRENYAGGEGQGWFDVQLAISSNKTH